MDYFQSGSRNTGYRDISCIRLELTIIIDRYALSPIGWLSGLAVGTTRVSCTRVIRPLTFVFGQLDLRYLGSLLSNRSIPQDRSSVHSCDSIFQLSEFEVISLLRLQVYLQFGFFFSLTMVAVDNRDNPT